MLRVLARIIVLLLPALGFAFWLLGPVQKYLAQGKGLIGILYMLAGLAVFSAIEIVICKFWLLPLMARSMSERLYAGSYLPEDDPLVVLVERITREHSRELLPELVRMVESDPRRVRSWLELARVLEGEFSDVPEAVRRLLQGAEAVHNKEDAAMLIWRAATMCARHSDRQSEASALFRRVAEQYPNTNYGRLAADRLR